MKSINPFILLVCACALLVTHLPVFAQLPPVQWTNLYGGSSTDVSFFIKGTADGGTIAGGYTTSKDGDVTSSSPREYWDLWIVKLDRCGNIRWQRSFGGTDYESARDLVETADGGYLVLGETNSTDGDVVPGYGSTKDIWLLKLDNTGNPVWQKRLGGSGLDIGNQLYPLNDGNFLIAATSSSNDGIATGNHGTGGYTDGLLIKIDPLGNVIWSRCYGGTKNEELLDIAVINDKIHVAGYANSTDGDIPSNQKNYDVWLLTTDLAGNKTGSRIFGGAQNDVAYSMTRGADGSLTLAGYTTSADGDVSNPKGSQDYWILNVNTQGQLNWQKTLGGSEAEYASYIFTDADGGYIAAGITYSPDGDVTGARGLGDFWLVKLNSAGSVVWSRIYGGSATDYLRAVCYLPAAREYYLAGDSESDDGDFENSNGETDFAVIKLQLPDTLLRDTLVCDVAAFRADTIMLQDVCGYDSALVAYRPVALTGPFDVANRADTIFEGQNISLPSRPDGNIRWTPHPSLSCTQCHNPVASPAETTVYTATITLNDCQVTDHFRVVVFRDALIRLPNAFTPNGDGVNDYFGPAGKVPEGYQLQIFNRYGEMVFSSSSINDRWDGRYRGVAQPSNVFVYQVRYKNMQQQPEMKKGTVMLIR